MATDRILVTGGAGFIGSHVVDTLAAAGYEPHVVDTLTSGRKEYLPAEVPVHETDICNAPRLADLFNQVRPRYVCHHAAQVSVSRSVRDPVGDAAVNILGWLNVLAECQRMGVERVIFASSGGALYGDVDMPASEETPIRPASPYAISKWTGEQYLRFFAAQYGISGVALRYANVYGPRQGTQAEAGVVAIFTERLLTGQPPVIFGDGGKVRDYVYVSDVARANLMALQAPLPAPVVALNIGTGKGTDVSTLEGTLRRCVGDLLPPGRAAGPPPVWHAPHRPGDLRSSIVSAVQAGAVLGWQPQVDLDEGLRRTVAWYAASGSGPLPPTGQLGGA